MERNNFINIDASLLDKPIYRIMPIHRVLQVLEKQQLVLVKPKRWDDPFENALLASAFETADGEKATFLAKDSVYGQCWTLHRETDAMWRIYSANKDGVRVSSTPRKLLDALKQSEKKFPELRCFLGQVSYLSKARLLKKLGGINLLESDGSGIAESLLYKRTEFAHEKEVRLIYSGADGECASDTYPFSIDPNIAFDRLTFDPRMDSELRAAYRLAFTNKGYQGRVTVSILYKPPAGLVFTM